jgi:hypothetical protein
MQDQTVINGLLAKRKEFERGIAEAQDRIAILSNDIEAIDRLLESFGHSGDFKGRPSRQARIVLFYRNQLRDYLLAELRKANRPLSTRELACLVCQCEGKDPSDRRLLRDIVGRVGCALRQMRAAKIVQGGSRNNSEPRIWSLV